VSGKMFFGDTMLALIEAEREIAAIRRRGEAYLSACESARAGALPRGDAISEVFHKANEGVCAVRIILGGAVR
jgi:hypothetical protein